MTARDEILARVRAALAAGGAVDEPIEWSYARPTPLADDLLSVFETNLVDYGATVVRTPAADLATAIASALNSVGLNSSVGLNGVASVVVPGEAEGAVPASWLSQLGARVIVDHPGLTAADLDQIDAVLTGCLVAAAETGTICLDHGPEQGRRIISLVPDRHVCVVRADQVVSDVPELVAAMSASVAQGRAITWLSGGSATSDIELSRVEGVHGPRHLQVIVVTD